MQDAIRELEAAIGGTGGVLVCGEQGSGRELFARAIHNASDRRHEGSVESLLRLSMHEKPKSRPFVVIDCANREALEERLFGYTPLRRAANYRPRAHSGRVRDPCGPWRHPRFQAIARNAGSDSSRGWRGCSEPVKCMFQLRADESVSQVTFRPIATA